ncbi:hypothetical protein RYX36_032991 [Vicia faba]
MAVNCISSTNKLPNHKYESFLKYPKTEFMFKRNFFPLKKTSSSVVLWRIPASINNKVYEDQSEGIVCYQDEHGEIICEGYDEGPCFQRISKSAYQYPIPARLLKEKILVMMQMKDLNCNGFNSFC